MSDVITLSQRVSNLEVSPQFQPYSKVVIHVSDDTVIEAGDDTGRTLEMDNPFATQQMAVDILNSLSGYQYQPYDATGALLDPAAEMGDAANIRGTYGGIYTRYRTFGHLAKANISAPQSEEINHEYTYENPQTRQFRRQVNDVRASLILTNQSVEAKVSKTGGDNSSFGWSLLSDEFALYSGSRKVFRASDEGVEVDGKITAREGYIGNGSRGFTITATAIFNNISEFGGTQSQGIYLGTNGIQLGQNFKVDSYGNLECQNATVSGILRARAVDIQVGGSSGYISSGQIGSGVVGTEHLTSYCGRGIGGGINFTVCTVKDTLQYPANFTCGTLYHKGRFMQFNGQACQLLSKTIDGQTIHYIGYV